MIEQSKGFEQAEQTELDSQHYQEVEELEKEIQKLKETDLSGWSEDIKEKFWSEIQKLKDTIEFLENQYSKELGKENPTKSEIAKARREILKNVEK